MITTLFPRVTYRAIEERYGAWQSRLAFERTTAAVVDVDLDASPAGLPISTSWALVATTPLIVPPLDGALERLVQALEAHDSIAAVPVANDTHNDAQHRPSAQPYLTLRQFEETARTFLDSSEAPFVTTWDASDPGLFLVRTAELRNHPSLRTLLDGRRVVVVPQVFFHRYTEHRSQVRLDLLELIDEKATSILEFGCGEAALGAALKKRQNCRVVGIELDPEAAAIARTRIDAVYAEDVRSVVDRLDERFDWIVGGDVVEHIEDPWSFLQVLRKVARPGGKLLLSLPNVSAWPIIADLLRGRFDYVYLGILCAGHVRFFTRDNVKDMLAISGWGHVDLRDQWHFATPEYEKLAAALTAAEVPFSPADLLPTGHYVIATNDAQSG